MRCFTRWFRAGLLAGALFGVPALAAANGRFPRAQTILTVPGGDGATVYLRATFGVLKSTDGGAHFRFLCEEAMGFSGTWDPPLAVTPKGRLLVGTERGLRESDDGCAFRDVPELAGQFLRDLTLDAPAAEGAVAAITGGPDGPVQLYRGGGAGKPFRKTKGQIPGAVALTFEIAPSDGKRVYVTVQKGANEEGFFFRSDDGGDSFREVPVSVQLEEGEQRGRFFVSSVDPKDRDRLLLRRLSNKGSELLLSTDGGTTFRRVLRMASAMYGFARSADGQTLYAGSGLPSHGIYRSIDRGEHFEPSSQTGTLCLLATPAGVLSCENGRGAHLLARGDLGAKAFVDHASYADILGPAPGCATCAAPWTTLQGNLAPLLSAPAPSPSANPAASETPRVAEAGAPTGAAAPAGSSGCRCSVPAGQRAEGAWAWALALGALFLRRRLVVR